MDDLYKMGGAASFPASLSFPGLLNFPPKSSKELGNGDTEINPICVCTVAKTLIVVSGSQSRSDIAGTCVLFFSGSLINFGIGNCAILNGNVKVFGLNRCDCVFYRLVL